VEEKTATSSCKKAHFKFKAVMRALHPLSQDFGPRSQEFGRVSNTWLSVLSRPWQLK